MADDFFAVLGLERRPWLEVEAIKERFHALSATQHPDAGGTVEQFSRLNEAARVLSEPSLRVKHLLELELELGPVARGTVLDAEMQSLFMETGGVLQAVKKWREKDAATVSPLGKALLAGDQRALQIQLGAALVKVEREEGQLLGALRQMNVGWAAVTAENAAELASLAERLAFCVKWLKQLREAGFQLS